MRSPAPKNKEITLSKVTSIPQTEEIMRNLDRATGYEGETYDLCPEQNGFTFIPTDHLYAGFFGKALSSLTAEDILDICCKSYEELHETLDKVVKRITDIPSLPSSLREEFGHEAYGQIYFAVASAFNEYGQASEEKIRQEWSEKLEDFVFMAAFEAANYKRATYGKTRSFDL